MSLRLPIVPQHSFRSKMKRTSRRIARIAGFLTCAWGSTAAQVPPRIVPVSGLSVVETHRFSGGERESVVTIEDASNAGIRYGWRFVDVHANGDTVGAQFTRFVSAEDLAGARRLHIYHESEGPQERPGSTAFSLSGSTYRTLRKKGTDSVQIMSTEIRDGTLGRHLGISGAARQTPVLWRGTLSQVSTSPEPFSLLINGRRVTVPALHLRAHLTATRGRRWEPEIWVLADSTYPMVLRWKGDSQNPANLLQTVRIDLPEPESARQLELALTTACRADLPGIYFASGSADLEPASDRAIATLARMLARHPEWTGTLEGHTDSIGTDADNRALSQRRVEAVLSRLTSRHHVSPGRLRAVGHGETKPRESNATIEGRAGNRRVELARDCAAQGR